LIHAVLGSVSLNKLLVGTLLAFTCLSSFADDLKVADDFKSGDLVSADTFNQIFDTIEKINRSVVDSDLVGVWSCTGLNNRADSEGWTSKGLFSVVENAQVNFIESSSSASVEGAYSISTGTPNPFLVRSGLAPFKEAFTASYVVYKNNLITKHSADPSSRMWEIKLISPTRFQLIFADNSSYFGGSEYASMVVCDSAEAVPASPTSPTATNNKTGINLAWTDSSSDETGFKVYRKLSTETEAKVIATQSAVTYSDTDLSEGQTAFYHVTAYNDNGESAKSKAVSATLDGILPTVVSVTPINNAVLTDADVDFSEARNGVISLAITFSENIEVVCIKTNQMGQCDDSLTGGIYGNNIVTGAIPIAGGDNAYTWITNGDNGSTFINTIPCTACNQADNTDSFTITVRSAAIKDANGNLMAEDYTWSFTINDTDTYGGSR
jgi:hypothetical protein